MKALPLVVALFFCANVVNTLELKSVQEGSCIDFPPLINLNMTWVMNNAKNVKYFGGGSRYNMYAGAALHPSFGKMRPFEFYYNSCFGANLNLSIGIGSIYGFGDLLGDFELRPGNAVTEPGVIYFVKIGQPKLTIRHQVTLTDYKSFVFFSNCWMESNQRAWSAGTFEPNPSEEMIQTIESHATLMGFQRKNFIFFRYETCPPSS
ncbi:hypothetical protein Bhyg_10051 [Pseudolycoriella hygida]|uniref:Uncharacterized protein n=1 Tax=Pseudolycoriella hygida TaxID=35572 RepID=A0A9Q0RYN4_9DIPT|nr:hypothetical protein Bhyg_10051 [Pseudolycoriella hygida]